MSMPEGRRWWVGLVAILLALGVAAPAAARVEVTVGEPDAEGPAVEDIELPTDPVDLGVVPAPLRFEAGPGVALELADGRRFLDRLELRSPGDGQVLINDVTVDDYVAGVAEMPGRWHLEALKAQAVAARTYAWHAVELGTFSGRGYDICDSVDCQAFAGASQQEGDSGERWRAAVDATAGEVLVDDQGAPILARYFSTSGGRTLPNEVVFPSSGPRPYLQGVDDPEDEVSPYHRWEVRFSREEFEAVLSRGEQLARVVPLASVERLGDVDLPGADVRFTGEDGTEVVLDSVDVRRFVSSVAPDLYPDRFPSRRSDGLRNLPATLPSSRFAIEVGDDEVVVLGRGWGHAVGMGQYGARGRAERGATYDEILGAYYSGLQPTTSEQLPERIRVGLSRPAVGSVTPDGPMRIVADGEVVVEDAAGTWTVSGEGGGVRLTGPPGWGQAAAASRTEPAVGVPSLPRAVGVEATTGAPGTLTLRVEDDGGEVVLDRRLGAVAAGRQVAVWDGTDADGDEVAPGPYTLTLVLTAPDGSTAGTPLPVTVTRDRDPVAVLTSGEGGSGPLAAILGLLAAVGAALLLLARRRGRGRAAGGAGPGHRDPPTGSSSSRASSDAAGPPAPHVHHRPAPHPQELP
jgi:SpoIID/LytB domain protein